MQGRLETELRVQESITAVLAKMPTCVTEWYFILKASRLTVATCRNYVFKISKFLNYISDDPKNLDFELINLQSVESYLIAMQTKTNEKNGMILYTSDSYQQGIWYSLNSFLDFMAKRGYIPENYINYIAKPKNRDEARIENERILLTQKDFNKILKYLREENDTTGTIGVNLKNRDILIFLLFMTTGMRKTALSEINISDYDEKTHTIKIIDKGNKLHVYSLNSLTVQYLDKWLEDRKSFNIKNDEALFLNYLGERLKTKGITKLVSKVSEESLGYKISPHKLRAGFCSVLYDKTHDIEFVRRAVGHSNINTTQRYIRTKNNEREVASKIMNDIFKQ